MGKRPKQQKIEIPPPPDEQVLLEYRRLAADIDSEIRRISEALPDGILQCRPGCSECCVEFSVFPLEAAVLTISLKKPAVDNDASPGCCIFLIGDRCSIYEARPILCRTQGLPIGYLNDEESSVEVSACLLNFPEHYRFSAEEILMMDRFNHRLAELNRRYCETAGLDPHQRIALSDLCSEKY